MIEKLNNTTLEYREFKEDVGKEIEIKETLIER